MSGKLRLICMKVFMLKLDLIYTTFHTSVKCRKITFNSYSYNFFLFLSPKYFLNIFFLKLRFLLITFHAFRL